jgi:hypothetical protein
MEPVAIAGKLLGMLRKPAVKLWRRFRYGSRASLELSWEHSPIVKLYERNPTWRALELTVIASKDEEFVIAEGTIEVRESGTKKWEILSPLADYITLPVDVPKNRPWKERLSAGTLAKTLRNRNPAVDAVEIRVTLKRLPSRERRNRPARTYNCGVGTRRMVVNLS